MCVKLVSNSVRAHFGLVEALSCDLDPSLSKRGKCHIKGEMAEVYEMLAQAQKQVENS